MMDKIIELLKQSTGTFPLLLLHHYKDLKLTDSEFVLLVELLNTDLEFNPKKMSQDLKMDLNDVLEEMNGLVDKGILKIEVRKVRNLRSEYINLDDLYEKLAFFIVNEDETSDSENIFDIFEREFGRTLSPMEYEIIQSWCGGEFSQELIVLALKEATYNGANNLRYIDKILYEWKKKGIKTKEDVEKQKSEFHKKKELQTKELFDYDWLNEREDTNN